MAYNNKNLLSRIKEVQDEFLLRKKDGVSTKYVYNTYIYPKFKISQMTFYNYMARNARKELTEINNQMQLFSTPAVAEAAKDLEA